MDGMIVTLIAPVTTATQTNKDEKKARDGKYKSKAKKHDEEKSFREEFAATYQHDPYAELAGITYKRPRAKGY